MKAPNWVKDTPLATSTCWNTRPTINEIALVEAY
jgi:hypothetical protein